MNQSMEDSCVFFKIVTYWKLRMCVEVTVDNCVVTGFSVDATWFVD